MYKNLVEPPQDEIEIQKKIKNTMARHESGRLADSFALANEYRIVFGRAKAWRNKGFSGIPPAGISDKTDAELILRKGESYEEQLMLIREKRRAP